MVDSEAMTSLSGSNPSRIAAGVWVVSTFLAGLAGMLGRTDHRPRPGQVHVAHRGRVRGGDRGAAAQPADRRHRRAAHGHRGQPRPVRPSARQRVHRQRSIPSIPFAFIVVSLVYNIIRSGRVNEEEGVGGALDRAITPHGGSRLAASADVDNPYPRLNFFFPVLVFAGVCTLPLIFEPFWLGQLSDGCDARDRVPRRTRWSPARAACSGSARSRSPASARSPPRSSRPSTVGTRSLAIVVGGGRRRGDRRAHRPAHDPARQPLRRAGDAHVRPADGDARVHPRHVRAVRQRACRCSDRPSRSPNGRSPISCSACSRCSPSSS